ncbi:MAG: FG-GAP repeat protein [Myxococcales bacterium]|nr:FG-GAP repeat protein [Myxococcales bacterium]
MTGDGIADVIVRGSLMRSDGDGGSSEERFVEIYVGRVGGAPTAFDQRIAIGNGLRSIAVADVTGDGIADLLVGDGAAASGRGVVRVFAGGALPLMQVSEIESPESRAGAFGMIVDALGDLNGDGYADVAVQAPGTPLSVGANRLHVFAGSSAGVSSRPARTFAALADEIMSQVAGCDIDGDGLHDLLFSASRTGGAGPWSINVHRGDPVTLISESPRSVTGSAMTTSIVLLVCAGDVDADGFNDVAVTEGRMSAPTRGLVLRGGSAGLVATELLAIESNVGGGMHRLGLNVGGDIDADGRADLLVDWHGTISLSPTTRLLTAPSFSYATGIELGEVPTVAALTGTFTRATKTLGDIDGDGYFDFAFARSNTDLMPSGMELHFRFGAADSVDVARRARVTRRGGAFLDVVGL